tara:strand:+ start:100 stop:762 length:663 start_codon:yes stop_codon:yes gene_type:complete
MKITINVPNSLKEITLEQYQRFEKINTKDNQETNFLLHKTVEIFCDLDLKDIATIRVRSIKKVLDKINKVFSRKADFIPRFKLNGIDYGFIPKLDDLTLGEYIDLDENFSNWEKMHNAMAVLYRPITFIRNDKYLIEEYKGLDKAIDMKAMPLDVVLGAMVFFYRLSDELLATTLSFLKREAPTQINTTVLADLEKSGDGCSLFMASVREMLPVSGMLQK